MPTVRSADGTTIAYDRRGSGPLLVLVGGAFTARADLAPLAEELAPSFTVLAHDRRGLGDSSDTLPYAVQREIEDIVAVVASEGGPALGFGHSSGAALALEAAAHGAPLGRTVLYEPPFIVDGSRAPLGEGFRDSLRDLVSAGKLDEALEYWMGTAIRLPADQLAAMRAGPSWASLRALVPTAVHDATIVAPMTGGTALPVERWTSVTSEVLVMDGDQSPDWQRTACDELARVLPDARRRTVPGVGHGVPPDVLAPLLVEFLLG